MNKKSLIFGAWCAPLAFLCVGVGWAWLAGFVPPPLPTAGAEEIAQHFKRNNIGVLVGCVIMAFGGSGPFLGFVATMSAVMSRMERGLPVFTFMQMVGGVFTGMVLMVSAYVWITAAYRPERDPALIQLLNDFAWLLVLSPFAFAVLQNCAIGMAILGDKNVTPLFPRWVAYFNFWVAFLYVPAGLIPMFKFGPFAWNGIIAFWLVLFVFSLWALVMPWALLRAIKRLPADE